MQRTARASPPSPPPLPTWTSLLLMQSYARAGTGHGCPPSPKGDGQPYAIRSKPRHMCPGENASRASHHPPTPPYIGPCPPPHCGTHTAASGRHVARTAARSWTVGRRTVRSRAYCRQLTTGPHPRSRPSTGGRKEKQREARQPQPNHAWQQCSMAAAERATVELPLRLSVGRAALTGRGKLGWVPLAPGGTYQGTPSNRCLALHFEFLPTLSRLSALCVRISMSTSASCASGSAGGAVTGTPAAAKTLTVALPGGVGAGEGRSSDLGAVDGGAKVCGPLTPTVPVTLPPYAAAPFSRVGPNPCGRGVCMCVWVCMPCLACVASAMDPLRMARCTPLFIMPIFSAHWTSRHPVLERPCDGHHYRCPPFSHQSPLCPDDGSVVAFQRASLLAAFLSGGHTCLVVAQASMLQHPRQWTMVTWGQVWWSAMPRCAVQGSVRV
jgi:hypothetical protein